MESIMVAEATEKIFSPTILSFQAEYFMGCSEENPISPLRQPQADFESSHALLSGRRCHVN